MAAQDAQNDQLRKAVEQALAASFVARRAKADVAAQNVQRDRARLEYELAESKNASGELRMVVAARDDELAALKYKHKETSDNLVKKEILVSQLQPLCDRQAEQLDELHRQLSDTRGALKVSEQAHEEARLQMVHL